MQVKILSEHGYEEALFGLGLSHGLTSGMECDKRFCTSFPKEFLRMEDVANKLAGKGNGHDKFLRQICVWLDITAPRYWWPEIDQYKVATVTQSESTMHTIHKKEFTLDDFEIDKSIYEFTGPNGEECKYITPCRRLNVLREYYNVTKDKKYWEEIIKTLPQSYLQRRILTCNYATLRNIIAQRTGHRLSEWAVFIDAVKSQVKHPELLQ